MSGFPGWNIFLSWNLFCNSRNSGFCPGNVLEVFCTSASLCVNKILKAVSATFLLVCLKESTSEI